MSLSSNFPNLKPALNLDFLNVGRLDPRVTFTRASTARYYDGVTTAKAEENLLLQSQDFTTTWVNTNTTDSANTETAPDGTATADTITDDATNATHNLIQSGLSILASTTYACSVFVKAGTHNYAQLTLRDGSQTERYFTAIADLSAGTISQTANGTSATLTSSAITSVGNSWYRIQIVGSLSAVSGINSMQFVLAFVPAASGNSISSFGSVSYVGTGTTIYLWGAQLEQRSAVTAYTATTTQPITNYIPVLLTAQNDVPRFDHNPTTGAALGLEIEEQRTNLLTYSEDFANAAWTTTRASITANTIVAPDGALTGDKLVEDTTASNTHATTYQSTINYTSGTSYTFSCFVKKAERPSVRLSFPSAAFTTNIYGQFNLENGSVVFTSSGLTASIVDVGNGWYRCSISSQATTTASGGATIFIGDVSNTTNVSYTGDGYSGIYIWGAQLEAGAFATSYIPTTTTALTRSADAASMTGTDFSSWYNASEGTVYSEAQRIATVSANTSVWTISDNTLNNALRYRLDSNNTTSSLLGITNGTNDGIAQITTGSAGAVFKTAGVTKRNDFRISTNGSAVATDSSALMPVVNRLEIGAATGFAVFNGTIRKFAYYPLALTNAELQSLTTV